MKFLYIANGSLDESKCYLEIALELEYIDKVQFDFLWDKAKEVGFLLHKFIDAIENDIKKVS